MIYLVSSCKTNDAAKAYLNNKSFNFLKTKVDDEDTIHVYKSNQPEEIIGNRAYYTLIEYINWQEVEGLDKIFLSHRVEATSLLQSTYTNLLNNFILLGFKKQDLTALDYIIYENDELYISELYPELELTIEKGTTSDTKEPFFSFKLLYNKAKKQA